MNIKSRVIILLLTLGLCAGGIASLFWSQELRYNLPTPVPEGYTPVPVGDRILLPATLAADQAYFLHFYNPDCPCSRFNVRHLRSLIASYRDSVNIVVVVASAGEREQAADEFGEKVRILVDDGALAASCGVYSTPQAAIIDHDQRLYYRGNYNRSRYCTQRATNFAELSLIALLNHQLPPAYGLVATQSYGCELNNGKATEVALF